MQSAKPSRMNWWWREHHNLTGVRAYKWKEYDEVAAYRWELARRLFPLSEHPAYTELSEGEVWIVRRAFNKRHRLVTCPIGPRRFTFDGFVILETSWNLKASDAALQQNFIARIHQARKERGIRAPKRNEGKLNRGVSWKQVELLEGGWKHSKLNPNQRSRLSQATKQANALKSTFQRVWKEITLARKF